MAVELVAESVAVKVADSAVVLDPLVVVSAAELVVQSSVAG